MRSRVCRRERYSVCVRTEKQPQAAATSSRSSTATTRARIIELQLKSVNSLYLIAEYTCTRATQIVCHDTENQEQVTLREPRPASYEFHIARCTLCSTLCCESTLRLRPVLSPTLPLSHVLLCASRISRIKDSWSCRDKQWRAGVRHVEVRPAIARVVRPRRVDVVHTMDSIFRSFRQKVSADKNRYRQGDFDLDLTYITSRVIAMAYPAVGVESTYRNNIDDVARMLKQSHPGHFMIYNLANRPYDKQKFDGLVRLTPLFSRLAPLGLCTCCVRVLLHAHVYVCVCG